MAITKQNTEFSQLFPFSSTGKKIDFPHNFPSQIFSLYAGITRKLRAFNFSYFL